jgi:hypothetical protein
MDGVHMNFLVDLQNMKLEVVAIYACAPSPTEFIK